MSNTQAQIGAGSYVQISAHGANSYSNIGAVVSFNPPNQSASFDDITNLQSPQVGSGPAVYKEQIPTMVDPGKFSATCIYYSNNTGYANLVTAFESLSLYDFQAVIVSTYGANVTTYGFSGYVSDFPQVKTVTTNKHLEFDLNVTISGAVNVVF